jgi:CheY-like chemotaxis protein
MQLVASAVLNKARPLVLIVEDKAPSLRTRLDLFENFGCTALGATSMKDAIRELTATPMVDLVVTDIHMPDEPGRANDKSGIEFARYVRQTWNDLPIAGYSAHFTEDELTADELQVFDMSFPKGRQRAKDIEKQVEACVSLAQEHRARRAADYDDTLERLRRDYEVRIPVTEILRQLQPDASASANVEGPLQKAGYRLRLISADGASGRREAFAVWLLRTKAGWEAEIYGYPELYSFGATEQTATESLIELMALFHQELASDEPSLPQVERLALFLNRIFANPRN